MCKYKVKSVDLKKMLKLFIMFKIDKISMLLSKLNENNLKYQIQQI